MEVYAQPKPQSSQCYLDLKMKREKKTAMQTATTITTATMEN